MSFGRIIDMFSFSKYTPPLVFTETPAEMEVKPAPKRVRRNLAKLYPDSTPIKVVANNPCRVGTKVYEQYNKLIGCKTVVDARASGWSLADLDEQVAAGRLHVGG